eukprot:TRINITY_DN2670_c1_g2_i1.p1 TRINITY_DN2670_c1_g2~~TRINITY_DN2670_c1_g2_i1.p1  ORF type:complete len:337 (-),score=95.29 TRINITY_DN2670_c1_g2_i1:13-1023(-)
MPKRFIGDNIKDILKRTCTKKKREKKLFKFFKKQEMIEWESFSGLNDSTEEYNKIPFLMGESIKFKKYLKWSNLFYRMRKWDTEKFLNHIEFLKDWISFEDKISKSNSDINLGIHLLKKLSRDNLNSNDQPDNLDSDDSHEEFMLKEPKRKKYFLKFDFKSNDREEENNTKNKKNNFQPEENNLTNVQLNDKEDENNSQPKVENKTNVQSKFHENNIQPKIENNSNIQAKDQIKNKETKVEENEYVLYESIPQPQAENNTKAQSKDSKYLDSSLKELICQISLLVQELKMQNELKSLDPKIKNLDPQIQNQIKALYPQSSLYDNSRQRGKRQSKTY